ncbi:hypothetical protein LTR20_010826 [Exophiala xenobiotica]|nr:hypothetical protein LTR40_003683 [Exophiala xenobiotica]KAK5390022.1 hypothetical protein LTS13_000102 [Exophiala xenobiotica]KAK5391814.1 hypothetical protein LTR79_010913 [Exophiala xenobiotica]KAK5406473.1 hypothetical protein LTR90_010548 [Exophiala xenobiotica]KAK5453060.1 hypothetical protein LTR20_010826 [Exophiala xenobiotica]
MYSWRKGSSTLRGKVLSRLIGLACSIAFILFGYEQGVMGGVITGTAFTAQFPSINTTTAKGNTQLQGFTLGAYNIGSWLGALLTAVIGERLGRKGSVVVGCSIIAIGTALQCSSFQLAQLIVGRLVTGLGNGLITSSIPVWHAELSKAINRGRLITVEISTNVGGVMVAYWVDYGMSHVKSGAQWRFPISLQIFFALSTIALITFLPESPRWLLYHDRQDEAAQILIRLHSDEDAGTAGREMQEIIVAIKEEKQAAHGHGGLRAMFRNGEQKFFYRTCLSVWIMIMQQLTGINLVTYYAPYIFIKSVGFSQQLSTLMSGFATTFYYFSTWVPIAIIDRVGRRPLLLGGVLSMAICMFILAGTTSVNHFATGIVSTVVLFVYLASFGIGWIPGPWLIASEYAPLATRSQTAAFATSATWIFSYLIAEITPISITNIGYKSYIIFGLLNTAFIPIIYFLYPETKGKSLEQIDLLFSGGKVLIHLTPEEAQEMEDSHIERVIGGKLGLESATLHQAENV